ncbi:MAG: RDD family protein [Bacilli bacterium]
MEIARFDKRIIAYCIDMLIAAAAGVATSVLLAINTDWSIPWYFLILIGQTIGYFIYCLFVICALHWTNGFTLGGAILGIKSIHLDRKKISVGDAIVKGVTLGIIPMAIVNAIYMLVIHTEKTIFDRLTDTIVVDIRYFPK